MGVIPGTRLGPYEILAPLGAGGMGEVYRARDPRLERDVAIKVLPRRSRAIRTASGASSRRRGRPGASTIRTSCGLRHRTHDGAPYVVEELLEGETLRERLAGGALLAAQGASTIASQIAEGLAAAHEKGIVHRDLKPENLFVTQGRPRQDPRLRPGEADQAELRRRRRRGPTATPGREPASSWAPSATCLPSRCAGKTADHRSDIFTFGAILYEMLTGTARVPRRLGGRDDERDPQGGAAAISQQ